MKLTFTKQLQEECVDLFLNDDLDVLKKKIVLFNALIETLFGI